METEIQVPLAGVKAGDNIRMRLIASKTDTMTRMMNGVDKTDYTGKALNDLKEGERFRLDIGYDTLTTSVVKHVGKGMFTTANSTYSYESAEAKDAP